DRVYGREGRGRASACAGAAEGVATPVGIARRCGFGCEQRWRFPVYQVAPEDALDSALARAARAGRDERLNGRRTLGCDVARDEAAYEERLAYELRVITQMGFAGYFLIVADFIN